MRKLFLISILLIAKIFASNIWFTNAQVAMNTAKKFKVPIIVFVYETGCPYCEKSISGFKYPPLRDVLSSHEILPVAVNGKDSKNLRLLGISTKVYPSYFLLSERGRLIANPLRGFVEAPELARYLKEITIEYKKVRVKRLNNAK